MTAGGGAPAVGDGGETASAPHVHAYPEQVAADPWVSQIMSQIALPCGGSAGPHQLPGATGGEGGEGEGGEGDGRDGAASTTASVSARI